MGVWRNADVGALEASWDVLGPVMASAVAEAQIVAAKQADTYMTAAAVAYGVPVRGALVNPEAFADVTVDGRELAPALYGGVTTTKTLIGKGLSPARAFEAGAAFLAVVAKAAVADLGREADRVAASAKGWTYYVRVVSAGACSRCAVLASKGEYRTAFLRHPLCRCTTIPVEGDKPSPPGLFDSPSDYFESLPVEEQDRVFTNAGAQAIRDGADPSAVVNARRGATKRAGGLVEYKSGLSAPLGYTRAGDRVKVFTTGEGTTARGAYGRAEYRRTQEAKKAPGDRYRRTTNLRLMPETLYQMADGDQAKAVALLEQYGYISP